MPKSRPRSPPPGDVTSATSFSESDFKIMGIKNPSKSKNPNENRSNIQGDDAEEEDQTRKPETALTAEAENEKEEPDDSEENKLKEVYSSGENADSGEVNTEAQSNIMLVPKEGSASIPSAKLTSKMSIGASKEVLPKASAIDSISENCITKEYSIPVNLQKSKTAPIIKLQLSVQNKIADANGKICPQPGCPRRYNGGILKEQIISTQESYPVDAKSNIFKDSAQQTSSNEIPSPDMSSHESKLGSTTVTTTYSNNSYSVTPSVTPYDSAKTSSVLMSNNNVCCRCNETKNPTFPKFEIVVSCSKCCKPLPGYTTGNLMRNNNNERSMPEIPQEVYSNNNNRQSNRLIQSSVREYNNNGYKYPNNNYRPSTLQAYQREYNNNNNNDQPSTLTQQAYQPSRMEYFSQYPQQREREYVPSSYQRASGDFRIGNRYDNPDEDGLFKNYSRNPNDNNYVRRRVQEFENGVRNKYEYNNRHSRTPDYDDYPPRRLKHSCCARTRCCCGRRIPEYDTEYEDDDCCCNCKCCSRRYCS